MTCRSCGETSPEGASFCPGCGAAVGDGGEVSTAKTMRAVPAGPACPPTAADGAGAAAAAEIPLVGATVGGRFQIKSLLGAGGMGTVYLAEQTAINRPVVLKFLHAHLFSNQDMIERFHREALAASKLSCPNTIVLHDFGQHDRGMQYMAMEFLDGQPLSEVIQTHGALPALRAIGITLQILSSLEEAHEKGIVHRDLKPDNIMLVQRYGTHDFVKVLDFGIAKLTGQGEPGGAGGGAPPGEAAFKDGLTQKGAIYGSPGYMAPEQVLGEEVDHRADIYAVGVILYEMLSGTRPFEVSSFVELMRLAVDGEVESLSATRPDLELPRQLDLLILECLQRKPAGRPGSAAALAASLRSISPTIMRHQQEQEQALLELVGIRPRWPRHLRWALPALVAILAVAAGLWFALRPGPAAEGVSLGPGQRLFVSASRREVPPWVTGPDGAGVRAKMTAFGEIRSRDAALALVRADVFARLADVPSRFDREKERRRHVKELEQVLMRVQALEAQGQPLLPIETFWTKLVEGRAGGAARNVYIVHAFSPALKPALGQELRKLFAALRYDRYGFLTDEAVNRARCDQARALSQKVKEAIDHLPKKDDQKKRLRFIHNRRLKQCL